MDYAEIALLKSLSGLTLDSSASRASRDPRVANILRMPPSIHSMILSYLSSRDILAFCTTCKRFLRESYRAYQSIHFEIGRGAVDKLLRTLESLQMLFEVLLLQETYCAHVTEISLYDSQSPWGQPSPTPLADDYTFLMSVLDHHISRLFSLTPNLETVVLDVTGTGQVFSFPRMLGPLLLAEYLLEVALMNVAFLVDPARIPAPRSRRMERVQIQGHPAHMSWIGAFICGQQVERLDLTQSAIANYGQFRPEILQSCAPSLGKLQDLSITCTEQNAAAYFETIALGVAVGAWPRLSSLSIAGSFSFEHLAILAHVPLRRLRLVVNVRGLYCPEFGPKLISGILTCFPDLEELVMDHLETDKFVPVFGPEHLTAWGTHIRAAFKLRVLVLSAFFVIDPDASSTYEDDEDDDDESVNGDDGYSDTPDVTMTPLSPFSPVTGNGKQAIKAAPSPVEERFAPPTLSVALGRISIGLAIFAEDFFDKYLRSTNLQQLHFLHDNPDTGNRESIGFGQTVSMVDTIEDGVRVGFMSTQLQEKYDMFWEPYWRVSWSQAQSD